MADVKNLGVLLADWRKFTAHEAMCVVAARGAELGYRVTRICLAPELYRRFEAECSSWPNRPERHSKIRILGELLEPELLYGDVASKMYFESVVGEGPAFTELSR